MKHSMWREGSKHETVISTPRVRMPQIKIALPKDSELPKPEGANFFTITHVQGEVELQVGYIDLHRMIEELGERKDLNDDEEIQLGLTPEITHRFVLSVSGLQLLKKRVDEIFSKTGLPLDMREERKNDDG